MVTNDVDFLKNAVDTKYQELDKKLRDEMGSAPYLQSYPGRASDRVETYVSHHTLITDGSKSRLQRQKHAAAYGRMVYKISKRQRHAATYKSMPQRTAERFAKS